MNAADVAVRALAAARLSRLVTTDTLPEFLVIGRLRVWASGHPRREEWVEGLDCPFCVGFWISLLVLALPDTPATRLVLRALALNYVVGHVSSRLDETT